MSSSAISSTAPHFQRPEHFSRDPDGWFCKPCSEEDGHLEFMSANEALRHELYDTQHARLTSNTEMWWNDPSYGATWDYVEPQPATRDEFKDREARQHVDLVEDIVPFWLKGIQAAERGEDLRFEDFFNNISRNDPWNGDSGGQQEDDWGEWGPQPADRDAWGYFESPTPWEEEKNVRTSHFQTDNNGGYSSDAHDFVNTIARKLDADACRTQKMHKFFELSTEKKVQSIYGLLQQLHSLPD